MYSPDEVFSSFWSFTGQTSVVCKALCAFCNTLYLPGQAPIKWPIELGELTGFSRPKFQTFPQSSPKQKWQICPSNIHESVTTFLPCYENTLAKSNLKRTRFIHCTAYSLSWREGRSKNRRRGHWGLSVYCLPLWLCIFFLLFVFCFCFL